ncbi:WD40 repeat protein [Breznakibacter xylanolyticus]|uniref:WD40 repeat protein n=1 Tax=Breznakibacter xylanolyticus TaxID=990 RepID=A0A2W7N883_9BACT|nr:OmpA family protein [Breznakibacter xylanolyticus]PZX13064.1 WD40 repeat protein [Breznakibacter xylanolyticus]
MNLRTISLITLCCLWLTSWSQENPKLEKEPIIQRSDMPDNTAFDLKMGEKYYRKGLYDEAVKYYQNVQKYATGISAFNYKMAICNLYSTHPQSALAYMEQAYPDVAKDYYYHLGKAFQYNLMYDSAKVAFNNYHQTLKSFRKKSFGKALKQLNSECDFGAQAVKDSLPMFIINLGPVVNSYFDDYNAVVSYQSDSTMYFTSRRPRREKDKVVHRNRYKERILATNNCINHPAEATDEPGSLRQSTNSSVAGIDHQNNRIFFYQGKWRHGNIYAANLNNGKVKKVRQLKGKINHRAHQETAMTVNKSGIAYFVSNRTKGKGGKDIYSAQQSGKYRFRKVRNLGPQINTPFDEEGVYVTPDGNTLYFSSNGLPGMGGFDVYRTTKQPNGEWSEPVNLGYPINSPADELFYRPTPDSMVAIYSTLRQGSHGGLDIYKIVHDPRIPFELNGQVTDNKTNKILAATVSVYRDDNNQLVTSAAQDTVARQYSIAFDDVNNYWLQIDAPGYKGTKDQLQRATTRHQVITQNYQLEKLKYPFTVWGRVTNSRNGSPVMADIVFKAINKDTVLQRIATNPQTGEYSITFEDKTNVTMEVSATDFFAYTTPLTMKSIKGDKEERNITLTPSRITYTITGVLAEQESKLPVSGWVKVFKPGIAAPIAICPSDSSSGKYVATMEEAGPFVIETSAEGYFFQNAPAQFLGDTTLLVRNFDLQKMKAGVKIVIENILFNSGKSTLKPSSFAELDKFANLLLENPKVRIEISGHTDNVGSAASNKKLSKERALTVRNYIIKKGITQDRLEYEGYGLEQPIADNKTEAGRAENRRVEIKILD